MRELVYVMYRMNATYLKKTTKKQKQNHTHERMELIKGIFFTAL
jgi:hypothetical protein